jgi:uridine kinase
LFKGERDSKFIFLKREIIIADGVETLNIIELKDLSNMSILVDIDDDIKIERVKDFYLDFNKCLLIETLDIIRNRELEETPLIKKTRAYADIIYFNKGGINI